MTDNRNTILAVILSGLVLIAWQYFYNMPQMERQRAQTQIQTELDKPSPQTTPGSTAPGSSTPQPGAAPSATTPAGQPGAAQPVVSRDTAIAASPRIKIETPRVSGSIALRGARIDDLSLEKFRDTVDPKSPAIVLFSPSNTAQPYYAEFGWVPAAGSTARIPDRNTMWQQEGSGALSPTNPVILKYDNGEGLISAEGEGAGALRGRREVRQPRCRQHEVRRFPSVGIRQSRYLRALKRRSAVRHRQLSPRARASRPIRWPQQPRPWFARCRRASFVLTRRARAGSGLRTDSYFTAMTYPGAVSSTVRPSDIHDATWGAMSAVYGGALHPTAEGYAAMADAALPAVRAALGLNAPPEVIAQPLPPPGSEVAPPQKASADAELLLQARRRGRVLEAQLLVRARR